MKSETPKRKEKKGGKTSGPSQRMEMAGNRVMVAVSGRGRLLSHLLSQESRYGYDVCGVVSSHEHCGAVKIAQEHQRSVYTASFPSVGKGVKKKGGGKARKAGDRGEVEAFAVPDRGLQEFIQEHDPALIVLAGFVRVFPTELSVPTINIHPALLPKYGGLGFYGNRVHAAVLQAQDRVTGASCHWVSAEYDQGAVISQVVVPVEGGDTVETLSARVLSEEKRLLCSTLEFLLGGYG